MAATKAALQEFDAWNQVIADVVYPVTASAAPAYLDLDDDVLVAIGARFGISANDVVNELARVVTATSELDTTHAFALHLARTVNWRRENTSTPPPLLPLLAVFSLAAERMASGSGMRPSNYYGRLAELLQGESARLGQSYRAVAEPLWSTLNSWLTLEGGNRGLPTAFSVGFRFVGLAISQALVREADRRRLERFFVDFEFTPRVAVPPTELEPLLDGWISQSPSPATHHLQLLWSKPGLRARIAEVTATELAEWDGSDEASAEGYSTRSRVVLSLELTAFPSKRLSLSPLFFAARPTESRTAVLAVTGGDIEVALEPTLNGALTLANRELIDGRGLLEGTLRITDPLAGEIVRHPKRMVVFKRDELSGRWLEVRQVLMGDDIVVLVASPALEKTRGILGEVARPGWTVVDSIPGLPDDWTLIRGIEVFARPVQAVAALSEFSALIPLTTSQLKLGGGLVLPSAGRDLWHVRQPPEVRAIDDSGESIEVRLLDLGAPDDESSETFTRSWTAASGSVVVDLACERLKEGNYAIELVVGGSTTRARRELRLRSSDNPDIAGWAHITPVVHDGGHPLVVVGADPDVPVDAVTGPRIGGVVWDDVPAPDGLSALPAKPWWKQRADADGGAGVSISRPEAGSCFYTGAHHEVLDPALSDSRGRPLAKITTGRCKYCGLERRYSSSYWQNHRKHERAKAAAAAIRPTGGVSEVPATRPDENPVDWDLALDALRFLGGGSFASLERVARQFDPSSLFLHQFVGALEGLGHIEVRRSPTTLEPLNWEVCATTVLDAGDRRVLAGYWTPAMSLAARDHLTMVGRTLGSDRQLNAPSRAWSEASASDFREWTEVGEISVAAFAGETLAAVLPPLSAVIDALPRRPAPGLLEAQWFDPASAAWRVVVDLDGQGGYRVGKYGAKYFVRTARDLADGSCARADASLAKHAASAALAGRALAAYDETSAELTVPLGANLPGMYERAAVLASGLAPLRRRALIVYRAVSPALAARLAYLLEN